MFERYTEYARLIFFFSCYEACEFGSPYMETEHLLLSLLGGDKWPPRRFWRGIETEAIRKQIQSQTIQRAKVSTSGLLPLSVETKRALVYAAEEADALQHERIDSCHLVLGLLRVENCTAAVILRQHGVDYTHFRKVVSSSPPRPPLPEPIPIAEPLRAAAPPLEPAIRSLEELLDNSVRHFSPYSGGYGEHSLKRKPWTRKQAMGHLIDLATTHHTWLVCAMTQPKLTATAYPDDEWVSVQGYDQLRWIDLQDLWVGLNRLLLQTLSQIPEEKVNMPCRIGIAEPVPLLELVQRYIQTCEDILGQLLGRL